MPLTHMLLLAALAPAPPHFLFRTFLGKQALQFAARWGSHTELSPAHLQRLACGPKPPGARKSVEQ